MRVPKFDKPMSAYKWLTEFFPALVREEPKRLVMAVEYVRAEHATDVEWFAKRISKNWRMPTCGTAGCLVGWLGTTVESDVYIEGVGEAQRLLELTDDDDQVFYYRYTDSGQGTREFAEDVIRNTIEWADARKAHLESVILYPKSYKN